MILKSWINSQMIMLGCYKKYSVLYTDKLKVILFFVYFLWFYAFYFQQILNYLSSSFYPSIWHLNNAIDKTACDRQIVELRGLLNRINNTGQLLLLPNSLARNIFNFISSSAATKRIRDGEEEKANGMKN